MSKNRHFPDSTRSIDKRDYMAAYQFIIDDMSVILSIVSEFISPPNIIFGILVKLFIKKLTLNSPSARTPKCTNINKNRESRANKSPNSTCIAKT